MPWPCPCVVFGPDINKIYTRRIQSQKETSRSRKRAIGDRMKQLEYKCGSYLFFFFFGSLAVSVNQEIEVMMSNRNMPILPPPPITLHNAAC